MTIALITDASTLTWAKVRFYYKSDISGAVASSSTTGNGVDKCLDLLEGTFWEATTAGGASTITFDAGVGNTYTADYLGLAGHNFGESTADYVVTVRHSNDNFSSDDNLDLTIANADFSSKKAVVQSFTQVSERYWKITFTPTSSTAAPKVAILNLGELTELDFTQVSFDPQGENIIANVNRSEQGFIVGIHNRWIERRVDMGWDDIPVDSTLWTKFLDFKNDHGVKPFFLGWEVSQHPTEIYLMSRQPKFKAPLTNGGITRSVRMSFTGRKE